MAVALHVILCELFVHFNLLPVAGFWKSYGARISVILNVVIQWLLRLVILCSACSEVDGCG